MNDMPMPICTYTIRKDEIDGPILKYAKVGDQVVHRWECDSDIYGILVHSCYVEDGQGVKSMVVDDKGCHKDRTILGDPTYAEALNLAYRESYVFKFADKIGVRFQCEIRLCVKESGGCNGITPPTCDDHPSREWMNNNNTSTKNTRKLSKRSNPSTTISPKMTIDTDLISQFVYVIDDDGEVSPLINGNEQLSSAASVIPLFSSQRICLSNVFFIFFACLFLALFSVTVALGIFFVRKQNRAKLATVVDSTPRIRPFTMVFN
uniref:ZP domain-containing protein n=1 Tax=Panagrolaimus superbus TaxID=310955 RepID=A0A914YHA4_9BILA